MILTTGAHIAPIVGGLIGQYLGWRWTFRFAAILDGFMFLIIIFCLPETLYIRDQSHLTRTFSEREIAFSPKTYISRLKPYSQFPELNLRWNQFVIPSLKMAMYPSVIFPALYYAAQYGFASILPAVTVASIFSERFGWNTLEIGLAYGGALSIGGNVISISSLFLHTDSHRYSRRISSRYSPRRNHQACPPQFRRHESTSRNPTQSHLDRSTSPPSRSPHLWLHSTIPCFLVRAIIWYGSRMFRTASHSYHLLYLQY